MISVISRTVIMYVLIIFSMRIMGKKNLGEFQPSDLVSTILISNLTSVIIEEPHLPIAYSVSAILIIMSLEVFIAVWVRKSENFSHIAQGKSKVLIQNGIINQKTMKELRLSVDDVLEALRSKDVFYLEEVCLAIVETTGAVNVYKDPDANTNIEKNSVPAMPVIVDSKIIYENLHTVNFEECKINRIMEKQNLTLDKILLMLLDGAGKYTITLKEDV
ncbi:MAG: DUF421 domain-containing protein [Oscillospiraceae bacterium]|nr:DUF421 domain-containing protein [Oscillospiraceae bacterium]MBQ7816652.1 DUF421 domain-containing protein [Oscillospiraceae bacterium]